MFAFSSRLNPTSTKIMMLVPFQSKSANGSLNQLIDHESALKCKNISPGQIDAHGLIVICES